MAKLCLTCYSLCAFILVLFRISNVSSSTDRFLYQLDSTHHKSERAALIKLLDDETFSTYQKRDVTSDVTIQKGLEPLLSNNSTKSDEVPAKDPAAGSTKKKYASKPQSPETTINSTAILLKSPAKNVGVNGAGQRKNITFDVPQSTQPPLLHDVNVASKSAKDEKDDDDYVISKITSEIDSDTAEKKLNESLADMNVTTSKKDPNKHYNISFNSDPEMGKLNWVELGNNTDAKVNQLLSNSHRRAATIKLSFEFPFYGHYIKNVTIATGGFLYTGDYIHSWLAATQYIAPLMANFDTSISNASFIRYLDNGTAFTAEWNKVVLQEEREKGEFTFQVTLLKNGDILFVYKNVPMSIENIQEFHHPVKVGLSDAYIMDRTVFFVRRKTIYEYDRVHFNKEDISNWTMIYLKALPTCLDSHDCNSCLSGKTSFVCFWCPSLKKCSTGFDRFRQSWIAEGCERKQHNDSSKCSYSSGADSLDDSAYDHESNLFESSEASRVYNDDVIKTKQQPENVGVSGVVALLFLAAMVSGMSLWVFYAYRNPHTTSGQILIRYRPSQWSWRRGEARYTAATIHM